MLTETLKKEHILSNTLVIAFTELLFMLGGLKLMRMIVRAASSAIDSGSDTYSEFMINMIFLASFIIPILFCVLYMRITKPESLQVFRRGSFQKRFLSLLIGLAAGFCVNGLISVMAGLTGSVKITFQTFTPFLLLILPFSFIQCTCEEVLLRGYVPQYMEGRHDWSSVAFVSGVLFIFHHYRNIELFGYSSVFCINVFLVGVMLVLLVRDNGNFWIACGFHTGWNYTQEYLFGLPNSGQSSTFALFSGTESKDTFFYNSVYGNEGSWFTTVVVSLLILLLLYRGKATER